MSKNGLVIGVAVAIIILWLLGEVSNREKRIVNLEKEIEEHRNLNKEIKKKLKELVDNNKDIDPDIANELVKISALLEIKQDSKAILSLVKIIENLLHKLYDADSRLTVIASRNNRTRPAFMDYLELAQTDKAITKEDFHLISVAKIVRDEEAHQLDVEKEKTKLLSSFIASIGIILSLCRLVKKKMDQTIVREAVVV